MSAAAQTLGPKLIENERVLDQLFAKSQITAQRLTAETAAIGDIQSRLWTVHLAAHLETRAVLTGEPVAEYDKIRGYVPAKTSGHNRPVDHHH